MPHRIIGKELKYRGKILELVEVLLELPSGKMTRYELVRHDPSVTIVPVDMEGFMYLVKQFRLGVQGELLEFPAGVLEPNERPEQCAVRELREEIGYTTDELTHLGKAYLIPGYGDELMHFFLARRLSPDPLAPDADEQLDVLRIRIDEVYRLADNGQLLDVKSLAALTFARSQLLPT